MNVRAKLTVQSVMKTEYSETVVLAAMYSNNPEDNSYSEATPSATLNMVVTNKSLWGHFKPGQKYYLDFTEAS